MTKNRGVEAHFHEFFQKNPFTKYDIIFNSKIATDEHVLYRAAIAAKNNNK